MTNYFAGGRGQRNFQKKFFHHLCRHQINSNMPLFETKQQQQLENFFNADHSTEIAKQGIWVVAQLAERLLLAPEVRSSNPIFGKNLK